MPDDYYVSQYSGEEIDALLRGAGTGTVRYDAAQTLTDAQKAQAQGNIGAAPDGYGLGGNEGQTAVAMDFDQMTKNGWYTTQSDTANAPVDPVASQRTLIGALHVVSRSLTSIVVQTLYVWQNSVGFYRSGTLRRIRRNGTWEAWEWIDPPMELTVEYRTTERYLGKPVYAKLITLGNLPNNTEVSVQDTSIGGIAHIVDFKGEFINSSGTPVLIPYGPNYAGSGKYAVSIPVVSQNTAGTGIEIRVYTTVDFSAFSATVLVKYTKVSD